jgi:hypothetical protein
MSRRLGNGEFGIADFFRLLDGESFNGEAEFQNAVIIRFNTKLHEFPPHYSYRDAIAWAVREGWIVVDGSRIIVSMLARDETEPAPLALVA